MKRSININQILALFVALFVATAFSACSDVAGPSSQKELSNEEIELESDLGVNEISDIEIFYGRDRNKAGTVSINILDVFSSPYLKAEFIFDTENSANGDLDSYPFSEIHIWAGNTLLEEDGSAAYPSAGKNMAPKVGNFPVNEKFRPSQTNTTIEHIFEGVQAMDGFTELPIYFIIHLALQNGETAFAGCFSTDSVDADGNPNSLINSNRWFNWVDLKQIDCPTGLTGQDDDDVRGND